MTSSATACGACGTLNSLHVSNGRHSASAGIANVCFGLTMMKVSYINIQISLELFCVYVTHAFRHFRSDRLANRLILFLSTRGIFRHHPFPKFPPPAPSTVQKWSKTVICLAFLPTAASVRAALQRACRTGRAQAAGSSFFGPEARGKFDLAHCQ